MNRSRAWSAILALAAAGAAGGGLASAPAGADGAGTDSRSASLPATAPALAPGDVYESLVPPPAGDLPARTADHVRRCAAALAGAEAGDPPGQEHLRAVQRSVLGTLAAYADDPDLEVRLRVGEVLEEAVVEARVVRMEASLPPAQGALLQEFRRVQPALFAEILSQEWSRRAQAVHKLTRKSDPRRLAEPLIILCLRHHSADLVAEAAAAVERCSYASDASVEALCQALQRFRDEPEGRHYGPYGSGVRSPSGPILSALGSIGGPRAANALLDALTGRLSSSLTAEIIEAMVATNEKRLVPTLVQRLDPADRTGSYSWSMNNRSGTTLRGDLALWALLRLTGQSPGEYAMLVMDPGEWGEYGPPLYVGFAKDKDRKAAYDKAKTWWEAGRQKPPYQGLEPLESPGKKPAAVDAASGRVGRRPEAASTGPATAPSTAPGTRPGGAALPEDDPGPLLAAHARRLAEAFRSGSLPVRDAARCNLLALHHAALQPLADEAHLHEGPEADRLLDALMEAVTEAGVQAALFQLPPDLRKKLVALLAAQPKAARSAFSLNWTARVEAANQLAGQADPEALAEPIVLLYLRDPTPQIQQAGMKLVSSGRYRADAVVDALLEPLTDASEAEWRETIYGGPRSEGAVPSALAALTKIKSPRAAPVLLALVLRSPAYSEVPQALTDALVATGELRVIPTLLDKLDETRIVNNITLGGGRTRKTITVAACDTPLFVLLKLTAQDPADYQMIVSGEYGRSYIGFKDDKTRKASLQKWNEWWAKAKNEPRHKDLQPLSLPGLRPPRSDGPGQFLVDD